MPSGRCARIAELPPQAHALLVDARRAVLSTLTRDGTPHAVPICFAIRGEELVMEVDDKPKRTTSLARLDNIRSDPRVAVLVDRWDEEWTHLAWVMVRGIARVEEPGSATDPLRAKYPQYNETAVTGPVIAIRPGVINWWSWS
ncbi:MAG: TIGR03668 family PPOX class F420-dependent oxidoreductase [Actinomycetota bacterium]|nr:TIGR03668 family PPOX class F420-dependent oxidoreductase [Actinomycetota bacterium]